MGSKPLLLRKIGGLKVKDGVKLLTQEKRPKHKVAENDAYEEDEGILYASGIDNWRKYKFTYENWLLNFKRVLLKIVWLVGPGPNFFSTEPNAFKF